MPWPRLRTSTVMFTRVWSGAIVRQAQRVASEITFSQVADISHNSPVYSHNALTNHRQEGTNMAVSSDGTRRA